MIVLDERLKTADEFIHIRLPFEVKDSADVMRISFCYFPKIIADEKYSTELIEEGYKRCFPDEPIDPAVIKKRLPLTNLITISLDAPNGEYIGDAHRKNNDETYFISEKESSPGFLPRAIDAGFWKIVLSVFSAEKNGVDVSVRVETENAPLTDGAGGEWA
ncbi:MAG: hypothetical protein LBQ40_03315 [Clostridiales bacterium]|jgi:hypothetical protein|nr:hypothetical protein [Clostridiales bacterium]